MNQKTNLIWAPAMMSIGEYSKGKKSLRRNAERHMKKKCQNSTTQKRKLEWSFQSTPLRVDGSASLSVSLLVY